MMYKNEFEWLKGNVKKYFRLSEEDQRKLQVTLHTIVVEATTWSLEERDEQTDIEEAYRKMLDKALVDEDFPYAALITDTAAYYNYEI